MPIAKPGVAVPVAVSSYQNPDPMYVPPQPVYQPPAPVSYSGDWGSGMSAADADAVARLSVLCCCLAFRCCVPNEHTESTSIAGAQHNSYERGGYGSYSSGDQYSCCGIVCEDNAKCGCCPPHCDGGCGCKCGGEQKCDCDCCSQLSKCCRSDVMSKCFEGLAACGKVALECLGGVCQILSACR